jgi:hypothetical protein
MTQQQIIDNALDAVKDAQDIALKQFVESEISESEAATLASELLDSLDGGPELDIETIMAVSQKFVNKLLGPHKRTMAAIQYNQLNKLSELTLDNYVQYCEKIEKLTAQFMIEVQPIFTKRFEESLIPALDRLEIAKQDNEDNTKIIKDIF